jgi:hypothetical protein
VALVVSAVSARQQAADARRGNIILFITEMAQRAQTQEFRKANDYIQTELSQFDPVLGVYDLPEPARSSVLLVGGFYQDIASLVANGVLDEDYVVARYYTGIKETWRALHPYILGERENRRLRGAGRFYSGYESLAAYVESVPPDTAVRRYRLRHFPAAKVSHTGPDDGKVPMQDPASKPQQSELGDRSQP